MKEVVIFDIDGCISDDRHRAHLRPVDGKCNDDYELYNQACRKDPVMNAKVVQRYLDRGQPVVFMTSRSVKYRRDTAEWLENHFIGLGKCMLIMRPEDNSMTSPDLKREMLHEYYHRWDRVLCAYDDREDVLAAYKEWGIDDVFVLTYPRSGHEGLLKMTEAFSNAGMSMNKSKLRDASTILHKMAETYSERNAVYGSNYQLVAPVMRALFPDGLPDDAVFQTHFHLFELIIVKLTRFANSGMTHVDSIHDAAVYAALIEQILENNE